MPFCYSSSTTIIGTRSPEGWDKILRFRVLSQRYVSGWTWRSYACTLCITLARGSSNKRRRFPWSHIVCNRRLCNCCTKRKTEPLTRCICSRSHNFQGLEPQVQAQISRIQVWSPRTAIYLHFLDEALPFESSQMLTSFRGIYCGICRLGIVVVVGVICNISVDCRLMVIF